jgi:hypothetical protein
MVSKFRASDLLEKQRDHEITNENISKNKILIKKKMNFEDLSALKIEI